jgi:plastocyanin
MRTRMAILTGIVLLVFACGGGDASTTTTSTTTTITTTTTEPTTTATTMATTTSTVAETTTTAQTIDITVEAGAVEGPGTVSVAVGDQVSVWVLSDVDAEIHVHGYDVFFDAPAGVPTEVALIADVPGIFEVELEQTHTPLFALEVTP